jgi:hypothetical protein
MTYFIIGICLGSIVNGWIYQIYMNHALRGWRADIENHRSSYDQLNRQRLSEIDLFKKEIAGYEQIRTWYKTHVCQIIKGGDMVKKPKAGAK